MRLPITRTRAAAIAAAVIALLATLGLLAPDDQAPAPAATPTPAPLIAAAGDSAHMLGDLASHTDLGQLGERELAPRRALAKAASASTTDTIRGCTTRFNQHNLSSRGNAAVRAIAPHYTVSSNVVGWADMNAIADFLDRTATAASAHFIIDAEGNCYYTVPLELKAWTQAAGNPFTVSIEFIARGSEGQLAPAQLAKGGLVVAQVAARFKIPLQLGDVTGCVPRRPGLADHAMYGACGGGHHDLRPFYGSAVNRRPADDAKVLGPLITAAKANGITSVDRSTCRKIRWWRAHGRPHGKPERNAIRRREALKARGVRCAATGPVRA